MAKKSFSNPVVNELKGSAWFKRPDSSPTLPTSSPAPKTPSPQPMRHALAPTEPVNRTNRSSVQSGQVYEAFNRTNRSTVQLPNKERTQRRAYDLLESQIASLRRIRATRELSHNKNVSMSELVREAVELLLKQEGLN